VIQAVLGVLCLAIWVWLFHGHGAFWRAEQTDAGSSPTPAVWPSVSAVVPARDEADVIEEVVSSLLAQDYPGPFKVILVDDGSTDGTAAAARNAARVAGRADQLEVVSGSPLPPGWTGKLWAVSQGIAKASASESRPELVWLTDADIAHTPDNLRRLVARAQADDLALVSLMAELRCQSFAERMLIPAFVYFFQMVYPFSWVNRPDRATAAAAGGCMLVRRTALEAAGGMAAIRGAIIDDCALGAALKPHGPIWLGLTHRAKSLRAYPTIATVGRMISRSAYAQLNYSPWLLAGTLVGLALTFIAPPLLVLIHQGVGTPLAGVAWMLMALSFQPMLRFYGRSPAWGVALPLIAALYAAFTLQSAIDVWRGRGGMWKGRSQARAEAA
jgi:hopene-associated glycosyltransferase HpnB